MAPISSNHSPFAGFFIFWNKKKSAGARVGRAANNCHRIFPTKIANEERRMHRGVVVVLQYTLPACQHHWPLLSHSLTQKSQSFKVTKTIMCLNIKMKFVVNNALPGKQNRDDRHQPKLCNCIGNDTPTFWITVVSCCTNYDDKTCHRNRYSFTYDQRLFRIADDTVFAVWIPNNYAEYTYSRTRNRFSKQLLLITAVVLMADKNTLQITIGIVLD